MTNEPDHRTGAASSYSICRTWQRLVSNGLQLRKTSVKHGGFAAEIGTEVKPPNAAVYGGVAWAARLGKRARNGHKWRSSECRQSVGKVSAKRMAQSYQTLNRHRTVNRQSQDRPDGFTQVYSLVSLRDRPCHRAISPAHPKPRPGSACRPSPASGPPVRVSSRRSTWW